MPDAVAILPHQRTKATPDKLSGFLNRGGRVNWPTSLKGASDGTLDLLAEINEIGNRFDAAKLAARAATDELDGYPKIRTAELTAAARANEPAPEDRTTDLETAVKEAREAVAALRGAQKDVVHAAVPSIEADAAKVQEVYTAVIDKADAKAAGLVADAIKALTAADEARALVRWAATIGATVSTGVPSPVVHTLNVAIADLER